MNIPYENASSGANAQEEIKKILRRLGCDCIGFMEDSLNKKLTVCFIHRGQKYEIACSASGWAAFFLEHNPHTTRHRRSRREYEEDALEQGFVAINSVLRDTVKSLVTMVEIEAVPMHYAFLPYLLTENGETVGSRIQELKGFLPALPEHSE